MANHLLREFVRESLILEQEDGGGDVGGTTIGGGGGADGWIFGFDMASGGLLKKLAQPFLDVGKTALAGTIDIASRVGGLVLKTAGNLVNVILPAHIALKLGWINRMTQDRTRRIKEKYKDVFDRTDDYIKSNDLGTMVFMLNPGLYIASKAAKGAADEAKSLYALFSQSGKSEPTSEKGLEKSLQTALSNVKKLGAEEARAESVKRKTVLSEETREEMLAGVASSPLTRQLRIDAVELVRKRLDDVKSTVDEIDSVNTLEQLQQVMGRDLLLRNIKKLEPEKEKEASEELMATAKFEFKKMVEKALNDEMKAMAGKLGPAEGQIMAMYRAVLGQVS